MSKHVAAGFFLEVEQRIRASEQWPLTECMTIPKLMCELTGWSLEGANKGARVGRLGGFNGKSVEMTHRAERGSRGRRWRRSLEPRASTICKGRLMKSRGCGVHSLENK